MHVCETHRLVLALCVHRLERLQLRPVLLLERPLRGCGVLGAPLVHLGLKIRGYGARGDRLLLHNGHKRVGRSKGAEKRGDILTFDVLG